jgi:hypothetical protein
MSDPGAGYRFRDGAAPLITEIDAALDRGEIDEAGWHARVADILRPAYLGAPTPQSQSGFSGAGAGAPGRGATWRGNKHAGISLTRSTATARSSTLAARMAC